MKIERDKLYLEGGAGLHWWSWGLGLRAEWWNARALQEAQPPEWQQLMWSVRIMVHVGPAQFHLALNRS